MMSYALQLKQVRRSYGVNRALDGLDLAIPRGVVCGLVGPNGAGKTTTFGIVGGVIRPDSGEVDILGAGPFDPARHRGRVTLLPQDCELSPHSPVRDLLTFFAQIQGQTARQARIDADRVLALVDLAERGNQRINQLSHGMRRRVAVAQALLGQPELVLLDEPTSGLDPAQVARLRDLFRAQNGRRTLIISSHILAELEATCDFVALLERGRCVRQGPLREITGQGALVRITLAGPPPLDRLREALPEAAIALEGGELIIQAPPGLAVEALNARALAVLLAAGVGVQEIRRGRSLEAALLGR